MMGELLAAFCRTQHKDSASDFPGNKIALTHGCVMTSVRTQTRSKENKNPTLRPQ